MTTSPTTPLQRSLLSTSASSLMEPTPQVAPPALQSPLEKERTPTTANFPAPLHTIDKPCFKLVPLEPWMPPDSPITSVLSPVMASDLADLIRYRAPSGSITPHLRAFGLQLEAFLSSLYSDWQPSSALYKE